ncbi:MAG: hypothetical protein ACFE9I_16630 [Candidatus Hermodarchaeota archaeon]
MKDSEESIIPQDDTKPLGEKKKDPISKFFLSIKEDFKGISKKSDNFFLEIQEDWKKNWQDFINSWNEWIKSIKEKSPKYRRFKKLYNKMKEMESKIKDIKSDTQEIKLKIDDVATIIEHLMENINDIEGYMKENLGSDWKVVKNAWKKCKNGDISKGEFIKIGLSKIGKKFAGIFFRV